MLQFWPTRPRENDGAHFFFLEDRNQGGELATHCLVDCVQYVGPVQSDQHHTPIQKFHFNCFPIQFELPLVRLVLTQSGGR